MPWKPITGEMSGNLVVTRDITARTGSGAMAGLYVTTWIRNVGGLDNEPRYACVSEGGETVYGLTHVFELPMP
jgi:hypothetical protein